MMKKAGDPEPRLPAGRGGQDGDGLPGRPLGGPAGGPGPRAEPHLHRPLPGHGVRPLRGLLHRHRQRAAHDPAGPAGPHGGAPPPRLHRAREGGDRQAPPGRPSRSSPTAWSAKNVAFTDEALQEIIRRYTREAGVRNMEREISLHLPQGRAQGGAGGQGLPRRRSPRTTCTSYLGVPRYRKSPAGGAQRGRRGHRPGLDRGGRRDPAHRGHADARQGRAHASPASWAT